MYWYKVKSMLIILFLIINVFLIGTITFRAYRDIQTEKQLEESVVNVLSKNNISLSAKIPKTKENMSIYPVTNSIIDENEFAKKILMGEIETSENGVYTLGTKKITISKGVFDYTNDGVSGEPLANEEILQKTSQQLSEMGFDLTNKCKRICK